MAIITNGPQGTPWSQVLDPISQILQSKVQQHRQQQQQMQQGRVIDQILSQLPPNASPVDFMRAFAQAQGQGVSPETIKPFQEGIPKYQQQQNQQQSLVEKQRNQQEMMREKQTEEAKPFINALETVNTLREFQKTGHLGPKVKVAGTSRKWGSTFDPEGQKIRAEASRLAKSLVQAAAPLKITNKAEFQHFAEGLEDPNASNEDFLGNLNGIERLIKQHLPKELKDTLGRSQREPGNPVKFRHKKTGQVAEIAPEDIEEFIGHPEYEELEDMQNQ